MMKFSKKYAIPFMMVIVATCLSSCSFGFPTRRLETTTPAPNPKTNRDSSYGTSSLTTPTLGVITKKTVNVTIYTSDPQCQELIPQQISVPVEQPVKSAVSKIIEQRDTGDFSLSGYRVTVKGGVATIDLQVSPNSQRQFTSLSICEQFALFGSLRKTLLSHSQWGIKEVRFTERGEKIVL
jgi:hypothetical protein